MKITDIEVIIVSQPNIRLIGDGSQDTVIIKVITDENIIGYGEVDSSPYIVKSVIEAPPSHIICRGLRDIVIGQDPFDVEKIWYDMFKYSYYYGRKGVALQAISGIDIAIWDICGKAVHKPIGKLLGGRFRDKIPAYSSMLMPKTEDEIKRSIDEYLNNNNFKGIKFGWGALGLDFQEDIKLIKLARKHMGNDYHLMIDIGMLWDNRKNTMSACSQLESENLRWIEEPLDAEDFEGYKQICEKTNIPISAGEELSSLDEFKRLIEYSKIDIVQPDVSRCGGLTVAKKIVDIAIQNHIPVVPHSFKSGILGAATLQLISAMKDATFFEYCCQDTVLSRQMLKEPFLIDKNGDVPIPDGDGLGIELNEDIINKYRIK